MLVYRLEDKEGFGPLSGRSGAGNILNNIRAHGEPMQLAREGKSSHSAKHVSNLLGCSDYVFAWNSLELMADFVRFPRQADRAGFYVIVYEADENHMVTFADGQIFFNRDKANAISGFWLSRALQIFFDENVDI